MKHPKVTVLMPVYNGGKYLTEAIESILSQSYSDFEFLIVNDGSTDNSVEIIKSFADKRIRLVHNKKNIGQAISLNIGIKLAKGEYVVRMDADDISLPNRIKKQVDFMNTNLYIGICGTWAEKNIDGNKVIWSVPTDPDKTKFLLLFNNTIIHPTVIMRKKVMIKNKLFYRPQFETAEDYELWVRASMLFPITNLDDALIFYRTHPNQVTCRCENKQNLAVDMIRKDLLKKLNIIPTSEEYRIHKLYSEYKLYQKDITKETMLKARAWFEKLEKQNEAQQLFDVTLFSKYLADEWLNICNNASRFGFWTIATYYDTKLNCFGHVASNKMVKFLLKCAIRRN